MPESDAIRRLSSLAQEMLLVAEGLNRDGHDRTGVAAGSFPPTSVGTATTDREAIACARKLYRIRRLRNRVFEDPDLFGEPAWDLLLDLFIAACEGKRVSVTSACIGAAVPTTTALRWIGVLEERNLLRRESDSADGRRIFVRLTERGIELMKRYIAQATDPAEA